MKKVNVTLFIVYFLSACGGGGGGEAQPVAQTSNSGGSTSNSGGSTSNSGGSNTPSPSYSEFSNKSRVIDGYITGANVFIDFNFNLQQDAGEPSAIASSEAGVYEFDFDNGFSAITDFSIDCAKRRVQVAHVPAGAIDSELGVVDKAYTMYHIPYAGNFVNITPFTGMFIDLLREAKTELEASLGNSNNQSLAISVEDGCGSVANAMASRVFNKSVTFANELNTKGYAILKDLYGDYIASFDNQNKQKAEKIVDFLKVADDIKGVIKVHFNNKYEPNVALSEEAIDSVFGVNDMTALPITYSINHHDEVADSDGWKPAMYLSSSGLKVLSNGKIVKATCTETDANNCEQLDPTYANIKKSLHSYLSYGGSSNDSIIQNVSVRSSYREAKYTEEGGDINCQKGAELDFFDSSPICAGDNCPQNITRSQEISHNYGFQTWEGCTIFDNPFLYVFSEQVNDKGASKEQYIVQYSLKPDSQIYKNPPTNFLGANKNNVDYVNAYNKIKELLIKMDGLAGLQNQLIANEFISLRLDLMNVVDGNEINVKSMGYIVSGDSDGNGISFKCSDYPLNPETNNFEFSNPLETEGAGAYAACFDHINSINLYN